jgi:hypothetical protein
MVLIIASCLFETWYLRLQVLRITGFLDSDHHPEFDRTLRTQIFGNCGTVIRVSSSGLNRVGVYPFT